MQSLYAPWRTPYHLENRENKKQNVCVFCEASEGDNGDTIGVFYRDEHCFCVMNKYPYAPGHFLIVPHIHEGELDRLPREVWLKMNGISQKGVEILKRFGADGINMGINIGDSGGAGIPAHLHLHLVPRWRNDSNFITSISDTRVYSSDFGEIFKRIKEIS